MDLFSSLEFQQEQLLELPEADILYVPNFLSAEEAAHYFTIFQKDIHWQQDDIKIFGKTYQQPRLTALYGEKDKSYRYSNITMHPEPFTALLLEIKSRIEKKWNTTFNVVLLNLYRDGSDSNGWHSDDEKELGTNPVIASVSLRAKRIFQLRNKANKKLRHKVELNAGSLLLMKGTTQECWQHQIPKTKKAVNPRINLTFRYIH
ncbi:alpha-ketoglutarate-dependent dioxygenase AlkB family protein [Rasiella sp. SM2506]|uniref:alpha-ketoglutarate-dependent dioxygenase AlkB family protein n=1 Tax=Rasiella sp. SM2506 TaxID=3423914 RepID=UPI003D7BDEE8